MVEVVRVAVPIQKGGDLEAALSAHFGHAPGFALVDVANGTPHFVRILENPPHESGGCGLTVNLLVTNGVRVVLAGGMGRGPLAGLMNAGVAVYHSGGAATAGEAVAAYLDGRVAPFGLDHSCQGHHH